MAEKGNQETPTNRERQRPKDQTTRRCLAPDVEQRGDNLGEKNSTIPPQMEAPAPTLTTSPT